jgi:diguanylate cyclase (GGDEF)-like protein
LGAREEGDLVIPTQLGPQHHQTRSDQSGSTADRTQSHGDRLGSDQEQGAADRDQLAAGSDWAANDRGLTRGVDGDACDSNRETRERSIEVQRMTAGERNNTATARDAAARERDISAMARDRAAEARDHAENRGDAQIASRDAQIASLDSAYGRKWRQAVRRSWMRAARDRQLAASDRARSALYRVDVGADRARAASDRALAARDRVSAAEDRVQAAAERKADEVDALTGARCRRPGLAEIQHEIDRANRGDGRLIAIYVDVDGLKATNDSKGHHAGDLMLKHIVDVLRTQLRSYEPVVRVGGDEFVCTISGTTIERARERFAQIVAQLSLTPDAGSITVGFAQLARGDSLMDLIDRADRQLIAAREARSKIKSPDPDLRAKSGGARLAGR